MKLTKEQKRRERKRRFKAAKAWLADHWQFNEADAQAKRPGQEILKEDVYQTYLTYCERDKVDPVANSIFGKALHRVFPGVKSVRKGPRGKAKHHYKYLTQREDVPGADSAATGASDASIKPVRKGPRRKMQHLKKKNLNWKTVNNPADITTKITAGAKRTLAQMNDTPSSPSSLHSFASSSSISDSRGNSHSNKRSKTVGISNPCVSSTTQHTVSSTMNLPLRRSTRKRKAIEIADEEEEDEEEVEVTATVQAKKKKRTTRILSDTPTSTITTSATKHNTTTKNQETSGYVVDDEQSEKGIFGPCGMHSSVPDHQNSNLEFLVKFLDKFDEKKDNSPREAGEEKEEAAPEAENSRRATSPYLYTTTHHSYYHHPHHQQLLDVEPQSPDASPRRKGDNPPYFSVHSSTVPETSPTMHDSFDEYYFVSSPEEDCPSISPGSQTNNLWPASWCCSLWQEITAIKGRYLRYLDTLRGSFAQCCARGELEDCRAVFTNFWQEEASRGTYHLFEDEKLRSALLAAEEDFFCSLVSDTTTFNRHFILDFADHMNFWIRQLRQPDLSRVFLDDLVKYYKAFSQQVQTHVLYDSDSLFQTRPFIPAQAELPLACVTSTPSSSASSSFSMPCDSYASMQAYQVRESRGEEEYAVWPV